MNIIPRPKKVEIQDSFLKNKVIRLESFIEDNRIINALSSFRTSDDGVSLNILMEQNDVEEAYTIKIEQDKILINAKGIPGAFYAGYSLDRKTDTKEWLKRYREKWLQDNKESELSEIEKMFLFLDQSIVKQKKA